MTTNTLAQRRGFSPFQEAAHKLAEYARSQSRYKARELVNMLTSQGERAARGAKPYVTIHLYIPKSGGRHRPVNLKLR
ncbi:hypothetical protein [Martelella endophytica]|uniref:Uncharacterized protein n=1 Tax=Martelella endophytica TaxID=1486262 RepID=A0A0D5LUN6_MAREN|nr:hypothetical protein [Martelella endophytica]AJY47457.1 hypothetical protein TM49_20150 [Martelella endophytica]